MIICTNTAIKVFIIFLFSDIAVCVEYFYEYTDEPESWNEASIKCQEQGRNLVNLLPDYAQHLNEMLTENSMWLYGITEVKFWTVHKVKKSSVTMFAESDDDRFPYDNKLADDDNLYCALGVFYPVAEIIRWIAEPCNFLHEYYCTPTLPFHEGSTDVLYDQQTDWDTANRRCQEEGGDLTNFTDLQWIEYSKYFSYNTSVWYPFRYQSFWTRHKKLINTSQEELGPTEGPGVTGNSLHCVFIHHDGFDVVWTTDDCKSLHSFICEMPAPSEDFYFFFELPYLSVQISPLLKMISNSTATSQECANICREENTQNLECTGFEVNHTSGTCRTHVQYFTDVETGEFYQVNQAELSNDTSVYDLHYIKDILGNTTEKTSTNMPRTISVITEITTYHTSEEKRRLETKQSTTFYQSSKSSDDNVIVSTVSVRKVNSTESSTLPFWLLSGFGAASTFVATTWLGIIIKRSKEKQKIYPPEHEQEAPNKTFRSNPFSSGGLRSF